jgi:hypothetical protein
MSYDSSEIMALQERHGRNPLSIRDRTLWMTQCPLILYYVVEYHLPARVMRQFGMEQPIYLECLSTSIELHR